MFITCHHSSHGPCPLGMPYFEIWDTSQHHTVLYHIVSCISHYVPLKWWGSSWNILNHPMFHQVSAKKKKLMKPSWSPHSHHFSWRKSWRSPRISQGPMGRHWESPPWRSRGRWKSRNARPAEDPSRICSICCWKETMTGWWLYLLWKMMEFVSWDDDIPNWMET